MKVSHKDLHFLARFLLRVRYGVQDGSPFQALHPFLPHLPSQMGAVTQPGQHSTQAWDTDGLLRAEGTELARDMVLLPSFCLEHTWKIRGSAASAKLGAGVFIMLRTRAPESDKH